MCGISGTVSFRGESAERELLVRMAAALQHRGPDASGVYLDGNAGLAHARLSIIDVVRGTQPMQNEDGSLCITFNGEIFNYVELRRDLIAKGHAFATTSDTEVVLHLFQEYGPECVKKMNGQWALAIWNTRSRALFLSRDRVGVRPLFYTITDGKFAFASEIKAIFADPAVPRELDLEALDEIFTFWYCLPPRTAFKAIFELPPGCSMLVDRGEVKILRYWEFAYDNDHQDAHAAYANVEQHAEHLLELLTDATRIRLRSDVPVGAYLSGGVDSSVIVALAHRLTGESLRSFSITFDDPEYDESAYQRQVVESVGTIHSCIRCSSVDIARVFPQVVRHIEKPILRTAPAPLFLLSRLAHEQGYKVVLTGEGSDEIMGGYDIFKEFKVRRFISAGNANSRRGVLLRRLYPYLNTLHQGADQYRQAFFCNTRTDVSNAFFSHIPRWQLTARLKNFYSDDVIAALSDSDAYATLRRSLPAAYDEWDGFSRAQFLESKHLLPGYILSSQGDRVSMAHSLEGRFPFLDHRVIEFAGQLPPVLKMRVLNEKYLLKRAAKGLVPDTVLSRRKQPYRAPDASCFFGHDAPEYVRDLLSESRVRADHIFDPSAVCKLVEKFKSGRVIGEKDKMALVGVLSTELLLEQFSHGRYSPPLQSRSAVGVTIPNDSALGGHCGLRRDR